MPKVLAKGVTLDQSVNQDDDAEQTFFDKKSIKSEEVVSAYVDYALKVSDLAAKRMCEGVIVASPIKDACEYCEYKAMCAENRASERALAEVTTDVIVDSVK